MPFWPNGKSLKDTEGQGVETCADAATFKSAFAKRHCIVPASTCWECCFRPET